MSETSLEIKGADSGTTIPVGYVVDTPEWGLR
jgi:hypothetical protein